LGLLQGLGALLGTLSVAVHVTGIFVGEQCTFAVYSTSVWTSEFYVIYEPML